MIRTLHMQHEVSTGPHAVGRAAGASEYYVGEDGQTQPAEAWMLLPTSFPGKAVHSLWALVDQTS